MSRPRRRRLPPLNPAIIADEQALGVALGELLGRDSQFRRSQREIIRRQDALRRIVGAGAWKTYLGLEEISVARLSDALDLVTRWAFAAGLRCGRPRRR
jgi:hypothetical protein